MDDRCIDCGALLAGSTLRDHQRTCPGGHSRGGRRSRKHRRPKHRRPKRLSRSPRVGSNRPHKTESSLSPSRNRPQRTGSSLRTRSSQILCRDQPWVRSQSPCRDQPQSPSRDQPQRTSPAEQVLVACCVWLILSSPSSLPLSQKPFPICSDSQQINFAPLSYTE